MSELCIFRHKITAFQLCHQRAEREKGSSGSLGFYIKFENTHCSSYLALTVARAAECCGHAKQSWLCHCGKPRAKARSSRVFEVSEDDPRKSSASLVPGADSREQRAREVAGLLHDYSFQIYPVSTSRRASPSQLESQGAQMMFPGIS